MKKKELKTSKLNLKKSKITKITKMNIIKGGDGGCSAGIDWTNPPTD